MAERVTVDQLFDQIDLMRRWGHGDVEVVIDTVPVTPVVGGVFYYPPNSIYVDGKPIDRPVVALRAEGTWE